MFMKWIQNGLLGMVLNLRIKQAGREGIFLSCLVCYVMPQKHRFFWAELSAIIMFSLAYLVHKYGSMFMICPIDLV
jgi:hypothetical protein